MSNSLERAGVVPAALSFLAIYNPSLSESDETFQDQIVYYYSKQNYDGSKTRRKGTDGDSEESKEEKNEKLRQVGLAQGMVGFAKYPISSNLCGYIQLTHLLETSQMESQWTRSRQKNPESYCTNLNGIGGF